MDIIKVLGQLDGAATTQEVLYTVPNVTQTTTSTLRITNRTTSAITYRVRIKVAGAGDDDKQYIAFDTSLAAVVSDSLILGMTLGEDDVVAVFSSATGLSWTLFGVETS